jgi:PAS domain S-box-containing protein
MSHQSTKSTPDPLRAAAETQLEDHPAQVAGGSEAGLLHELQVHRIELEMQNETLCQAQIELETSRDRYVDLYDFAPVGYLTLSRDGLIEQINLTCTALLGEERKRLQQQPFAHFVVPEDGDLWHLHFTQVVKGGDRASCELVLQRSDGPRFHARLDCRLDGTEPQVRVTVIDISARKRAEQVAAKLAAELAAEKKAIELANTAQYHDLVEHLHAGLVVHAADTRILFANSAAAELLGLSMDQMQGKTAIDPDWCFQHEDGMTMDLADYPVSQVLARDGEIENQVLGVRRPGCGDLKWLLVNGYPERIEAGRIERVVVTFVDITERRAAELALRLDREQQITLREMLEETVRGGALEDTLASCLARLLAVSWLKVEPQGGIFTLAEDGRDLCMTASHNLSSEIQALCARVPLGCCHCGRAAASREVQFSPCVDERHEIRFPGMADHGHYNLPLISEGEVLGVLALYLPHGFERDPAREQFLASVSGVLAGFIRRKQVEAAWQRLNAELEERVQLRTVELLAAKLEAERANQAKSEFLSRMSHELRTPLNAILGFGQLLELAGLPELQSDNVREVLHAGRHLLELINEMLDLARIESGKLELSLEPVNLADIVRECVSLAQPLADARGIELILADACGSHSVRADPTRLKQVLLNLLANAIKYNREQGTVSIACVAEPDDDAIQIRISDTGAGLTAAQRERLFIAFERLGAENTAIEGTGIGLVLSQRLVALMGGEIGVESALGSGSTFWVRLSRVVEVDNGLASPAAITPAESVLTCVGGVQFDLLCIEDNPANLRLVERILAERPNLHLRTANVPSLGLELALAHRPALILLDINLPDMDGYAVLRRLRESPATRDIPVLAISANAMPDDLARGKAAGFVDYLTKPLDVSVFLAAVDAALAQIIGKSDV